MFLKLVASQASRGGAERHLLWKCNALMVLASIKPVRNYSFNFVLGNMLSELIPIPHSLGQLGDHEA